MTLITFAKMAGHDLLIPSGLCNETSVCRHTEALFTATLDASAKTVSEGNS